MSGRIFNKRNLGLVVLGIVLLSGVLLQFLASGTPNDNELPSAASTEPEGRRALRELLLHFEQLPEQRRIDLWDKPPGSLPRRGGLLILPQVPVGFSNLAIQEDGEEDEDSGEGPLQAPLDGDLFETAPTFAEHHPRHYARFVHQGGTLLAPASEAMLKWLAESAEIEAVAAIRRGELPFEEDPEEGEEDVELASELESEEFRWLGARGAVEPLDLVWRESAGLTVDVEQALRVGRDAVEPQVFLRSVSATSAERETLTDPGEARGVILPLGAGQVVLLSDFDVFDNQNLDAYDHAVLALRLARRFAGGATGTTPILFDEYSLGGWTPPGTTGLLVGGTLGWITFHLALLVLFLVWRRAWAGPFARDPERLEGLAPLERTRAEGALVLRALRIDLLAADLFDGVFGRLERRLLRSVTERPTAAPREDDQESGEVAPVDLDGWRKGRMERVRAAILDADPKAQLPLLSLPQDVESRAGLHHFHRALRAWELHCRRRFDARRDSESPGQSALSPQEGRVPRGTQGT